MLNKLEKYLLEINCFDGNIPELLEDIANSIPVTTIPHRMKLLFAVSELILYTSQFRRNIIHWNGSSIPINSISFCIAKSGASKDSSVKAVRKCFKAGYDKIEELRKQEAEAIAIENATLDGKKDPEKWSTYKDYYIAPNPLFVAPSTPEGFIQHLNDLDTIGLGAGFIYSGEVGAELANNTTLVDNIKLLAELYDEGTKEVKVLKDRTNQSKEIVNLPTSALFVGSQDNLIYDENIKRKFRTEFTTKLARRSFFVFAKEEIEQENYLSIEAMLEEEKQIEDICIKYRHKVEAYIKNNLHNMIDNIGMPIGIEDDVRDLFLTYKRYNEELSKIIDVHLPISKLTRAHMQWKALKLSGALAAIYNKEKIEINDYKAAIEFVELLSRDIIEFEQELSKEPYELFCDYVNANAIDNKFVMNLHNLRKMGYIPNKGVPSVKLKELVQLATSYDLNGIYKANENSIEFEKLVKTDVINVSVVPVTGTKEERARQCNKGFEASECKFEDLIEMLEGDYAYTPFIFKNGIRGKDTIEGACKWVVLDVDSSDITDEEAHLLLSEINHHIVRTSNKTNAFKFRIILELDSEVDLDNTSWMWFMKSLSNSISIKTDILPKSQIYFSYSGRKIYSVTDAEPLEVKEHVIYALEQKHKKEVDKPISNQQKNALLNDAINTFAPAFNAASGKGSIKMIWAAKYAKELGASKEYIIDLMNQINNYWVVPLDEHRFNTTIINQINRWTF